MFVLLVLYLCCGRPLYRMLVPVMQIELNRRNEERRLPLLLMIVSSFAGGGITEDFNILLDDGQVSRFHKVQRFLLLQVFKFGAFK